MLLVTDLFFRQQRKLIFEQKSGTHTFNPLNLIKQNINRGAYIYIYITRSV